MTARQRVLDLHSDMPGASLSEIAAQAQVSRERVRQILLTKGIRLPRVRPPVARNVRRRAAPEPPLPLLPPAQSPTVRMMSREEITALRQPVTAPPCGIYFLFDGDELIYVGQSVNIITRIHHHSVGGAGAERKVFTHWSWVPCSPERLTEFETAYIMELEPTQNRAPFNAEWLRKRRPRLI